MPDITTRTTAHGMYWPTGLPKCGMCDRDANDPIHVTPAMADMSGPERWIIASENPKLLPARPHAYQATDALIRGVLCTYCGQTLRSGAHPVGTPSKMTDASPTGAPSGYALIASETEAELPTPVGTFAMEHNGMIVLAAKGNVIPFPKVGDAARTELPEQETQPASAHLWVAGRYVEADNANSNAAYWSTADLELGAPSVTHGPINWLHESQHIIGSIAAAELVRPAPSADGALTTAATGDDGVGNHIVAISALWPWLYPEEAKIIERASEESKLYYSMECISRSVACLEPGCEHPEMSYATYVREKAARCEHMNDGAPRRFVDPMFLGGAMIVPPVRPGWKRADAVVLNAADKAMEKQAAAFQGLSDTEALQVVTAALLNGNAD